MTEPTTALPALPWRGSEADTLTAFIDYYRAVIRRKAEGLTAEQLAWRHAPTTMSLGGLLKHLAVVEDWWFTAAWQGDAAKGQWFATTFADDEDWDFNSARDDSPDELFAAYDAAIARARLIIADALAAPEGLAGCAQRERHGEQVSLRWILVHMVEEYSRHAGHADLIREAIDGQTGD